MVMTLNEEEYLYRIISLRWSQLVDEYSDYGDRPIPEYFLTEMRVCRVLWNRLRARRNDRV